MKHQGLSNLQQYIDKWPYIIVYQHQGITVPMWQKLRSELGDTRECIVVKNSQAAHILNNNYLCSGSTCFIGTYTMEDIKNVTVITKNYEYLLFSIGGYWDNECRTNIDINNICNLASLENIWLNFISTISQENKLTTYLSSTNKLTIDIMESTSNSLYQTLNNYYYSK
jgi:ribosomal protein L10